MLPFVAAIKSKPLLKFSGRCLLIAINRNKVGTVLVLAQERFVFGKLNNIIMGLIYFNIVEIDSAMQRMKNADFLAQNRFANSSYEICVDNQYI